MTSFLVRHNFLDRREVHPTKREGLEIVSIIISPAERNRAKKLGPWNIAGLASRRLLTFPLPNLRRTYTQTRTRRHTHTYTQTHGSTYILVHAHTYIRTLTRTHTHAHTHTQTYTRTHALKGAQDRAKEIEVFSGDDAKTMSSRFWYRHTHVQIVFLFLLLLFIYFFIFLCVYCFYYLQNLGTIRIREARHELPEKIKQNQFGVIMFLFVWLYWYWCWCLAAIWLQLYG